ncbi:hypothetical protein BLA29_011159 [Euroglyphus maynei]|uniref:Uncharacterized protein n=1 Tax=Euroglyphus maynei TaxID=6958 RepID=A0A1Y3BE30_EURMA|nr:hypothetical protein BLA29_011159 [Euroglyphus maynei]
MIPVIIPVAYNIMKIMNY